MYKASPVIYGNHLILTYIQLLEEKCLNEDDVNFVKDNAVMSHDVAIWVRL